MSKDRRIDVQRRVHEFFLEKFASGEPVTKQEVADITQWKAMSRFPLIGDGDR